MGSTHTHAHSNRPSRTRPSQNRFCPSLHILEPRDLFSVSPYLPASEMLTNPTGLLTGPQMGSPLDIALRYLDEHAADLGLTADDVGDPLVTSQ